jgi:hypothetical protein
LVSRVIHEDVNSTKFLNASSDDLYAMALVLNVARNYQSSVPSIPNYAGRLVGVVMRIKVRADDISTFTSEGDRYRSTYATIRSGN